MFVTDQPQPHYLYLDSKIVGTAKQICVFFENGVFSLDTTVLLRYHRHLSQLKIVRFFRQHKIKFRYIYRMADLDKIESGMVFYPFNAASNTRLVANRRLKHIFVTHGESNKISSIKPIIRIYDIICVAGQAGIDRYLSANIFNACDVENGRVQKVGDIFVGMTGLSQTGTPVILYAPTWEGGIAVQENYSSLSYIKIVTESIIQAAQITSMSIILIKPHPNMGHRDKQYIGYLLKIIRILKEKGLMVLLYSKNLNISLWLRYQCKKTAKIVDNLSLYCAKIAFCDISAMETQLLNENIPYYIFSAEQNKGVKCLDFVHSDNPYSRYYQNAKIVLGENTAELKGINQDDFVKLKEYVISSNVQKIV